MNEVKEIAICKKAGIAEPCPLSWESLSNTENDSTKFCSVCKHNVYFCDNDEEAILHARKGHCIAFSQVSPTELPMMVLGRPTVIEPIKITETHNAAIQRQHIEREKIRALKDSKYSDRTCPDCKYPIASFRKECWVCRAK